MQQIDRKYPTPVESKGGNFLAYVASLEKQKKPALEFIKAIHKVQMSLLLPKHFFLQAINTGIAITNMNLIQLSSSRYSL